MSKLAEGAVQARSLEEGTIRKVTRHGRFKLWLEITYFTIFVLAGQSVATLSGRLYFNKGGKSIWMVTLSQTIGFPALLPFLYIISPESNHNSKQRPSSILILALLYIFLGVFLSVLCLVYSIGLLYLPVSTFSLICASQLGFNALSSFFLNAQKFTPYITNSVFLLITSSVLLVFQNDSVESTDTLRRSNYVVGFICTLVASAGYALMLSITQLSYRRILKEETIRVVLTLAVYQSMVASFVILVGFSVSGEWRSLRSDIDNFELGKPLYVIVMLSKAVSWQVFTIGTVGLIFKVSSLFANVISTVGLPIVPVLGVIVFHDKMNGVKIISMVLAMWGFVSYMYDHYVDDVKSKSETENMDHVIVPEKQIHIKAGDFITAV